MKWCPRCKRNRPLSSFPYTSARGGGGYGAYCRDCQREYSAAGYQANPREFRLRVAVSAFRKFRDEPEFWERVKAADERMAKKARVQA
jgi:hypothetical protein